MEQLKKCPFCGGELKLFMMCGYWDYDCENNLCVLHKSPNRKYKTEEELLQVLNIRKPMERYEELEGKLQSVYGECDGLLEKVVEGLVKHEGAEFEKPTKARLLTDEDVDKWDRLKGAMERIVERLEEVSFTDIDETYVDDGQRMLFLYDAIEIVREEMMENNE